MEERFKGNGRVKWFNDVQGFGIIINDVNGDEVFVHHSALSHDKSPDARLMEGQRVRFEAFEGANGAQACMVLPE